MNKTYVKSFTRLNIISNIKEEGGRYAPTTDGISFKRSTKK